jgi:polar amino acid transport system permease protein
MVSLDFSWVGDYAGLLVAGLWVTIWITLAGGAIGFIIGLACAWSRTLGPSWARSAPRAYVELVRNTPFLIQLYFIYFGLPSLGLRLSEQTAALAAMIINFGAYSSEIIRGGIEAMPRGQFEAGAALAMRPFQVFRYIVIVPALKAMWPALTSQLILLMFGSAVISQISVEDLTYAANFIQSRNFRAFETYIVSTLAYLCLAFVLRRALNALGWLTFGKRASR